MTGTPLRHLLTPWGAALDSDAPLPEYPRPRLVRDSFLSLNGRWEYAITRSPARASTWDGTIVVPFSPEAPLSGVGRQLQPDEVLHYRRTVSLGTASLGADLLPGTDDRLLLHFGAVDQWCRVFVNDVHAGEHVGGFLPFHFDITELAVPGANELRVVVWDPSDTGALSRGKQRLRRGGIWYTAQSGIWQTVWLERVPAVRVARIDVSAALDPDRLTLTVHADGVPAGTDAPATSVVVRSRGSVVARVAGPAGIPLTVEVDGVPRWTPEEPHLLDLDVTLGRDRVSSYTGLRTVGVGPDAHGVPRLLLNGEPYPHIGVLDQGYWSDGLLTPPADAAMVHDIATMKDLGFTMLRKHIKVEPLRWYYHCDRLGMLVWQDMVNGGERYLPPVISVPAVLPAFRLPDRWHRPFARAEPGARQQWLGEMRSTVALLAGSPAVCVWVPFNEGWGQFDAAAVAESVAALDPTRPVDHASGWHDQGAGDMSSWHVYFRRFRVPRRWQGRRVLALTEYGGYSYRDPDHAVSEREFGYRRFPSAAMLADAFARLHDEQLLPAVAHGLSATVYTQLSDVEDETNGLLTYDRRVVKIPVEVVRGVNSRLRAAFDAAVRWQPDPG